MSTTPESGSKGFELDLDLHFLPAWAQKPPTENVYAKYEGGEDPRRNRRGGDRREVRRDRPFRREGGRPGPQGGGDRAGGARRQGPGGAAQRPRRAERPELPPLPIDVAVSLIPEEKGVELLARQIRLTGRAYPLFDIAFLILKKPDRYNVQFTVQKKPNAQSPETLYVCDLDETVWVTAQEAVDHVLSRHFSTFYQEEKIPTDPPKGTYTFVAQCGMSGAILGPPNYHDYQNKIRKLHAERFSRVPFEAYKSRIKIVRDEPIVKKWLEEQSWRTEYICLNLPDPLKLGSREEVEKHFRETHFPNIIKQVDSYTLSGASVQNLPCRPLQQLVRRSWEEQMRFPLKVVNVLSQQFASHGLHFFKVNKTVTHVAVARPRYLDLEVTPVSESIKRIVDFIQNTPNCSRRKILEALAGVPLQQGRTEEPVPQNAESAPTPEAAALVSDLHWLIHQGHVIEFANGLVELAKKPAVKPPKQEPAAPVAAEASSAEPVGETQASSPEPASVESPSATVAEPFEAPAPAAGAEPPAEPPAEPAAAAEGQEPAPAEATESAQAARSAEPEAQSATEETPDPTGAPRSLV